MLRWLIGGGREPQGLAEKSVHTIGEEQTQNPYTELLVLKGHHDIVRFLVAIDDYRFASAGDDGIVCLWNAQNGEKLFELHAHTQKITALAAFPLSDAGEEKCHMILTAGADRTVIASFTLSRIEIIFDRRNTQINLSNTIDGDHLFCISLALETALNKLQSYHAGQT